MAVQGRLTKLVRLLANFASVRVFDSNSFFQILEEFVGICVHIGEVLKNWKIIQGRLRGPKRQMNVGAIQEGLKYILDYNSTILAYVFQLVIWYFFKSFSLSSIYRGLGRPSGLPFRPADFRNLQNVNSDQCSLPKQNKITS